MVSGTHMCYQNAIAKKKTNPTYYMSIVDLFSAVHVQIIGRIGVTSTPWLVGGGGCGPEGLRREFENLRVGPVELHKPVLSVLVVAFVFRFI